MSRRFLLPLIILATAFVAGIPFLRWVPATMVSIVLGVITLFVGLACRPLFENLISGLMVAQSRLINIGDTVKVGDIYGTVEDISSTHTTVKVWDWRRYVHPQLAHARARVLQLQPSR